MWGRTIEVEGGGATGDEPLLSALALFTRHNSCPVLAFHRVLTRNAQLAAPVYGLGRIGNGSIARSGCGFHYLVAGQEWTTLGNGYALCACCSLLIILYVRPYSSAPAMVIASKRGFRLGVILGAAQRCAVLDAARADVSSATAGLPRRDSPLDRRVEDRGAAFAGYELGTAVSGKMKADGFRRQLRETPKWVWAVKFLLILLGVILVHALWQMRLDASWGWVGDLRAGLGGMLGGALWVAFDLIRRVLSLRQPSSS